MTCAFCSEPGDVVCSARCRERIIVNRAELIEGDIYFGPDGKEWKIVKITKSEWKPGEPILLLQCSGEKRSKHVWQVHSLQFDEPVRRLRICEKAACWKHYREIADGVYRCQEHWMLGSEEPKKLVKKKDGRSLHKHWKVRAIR